MPMDLVMIPVPEQNTNVQDGGGALEPRANAHMMKGLSNGDRNSQWCTKESSNRKVRSWAW